jgi:hypothetical protein
VVVNSLKALDPNRPIREADMTDIESIGRLWFDSISEEWVYDRVQSARMRFPSAGKGQSHICVTCDLPSSGLGEITLRAFSPHSGDKVTRTVNTLKS